MVSHCADQTTIGMANPGNKVAGMDLFPTDARLDSLRARGRINESPGESAGPHVSWCAQVHHPRLCSVQHRSRGWPACAGHDTVRTTAAPIGALVSLQALRQRRQISASARRQSCRSKQKLRACSTVHSDSFIFEQALSQRAWRQVGHPRRPCCGCKDLDGAPARTMTRGSGCAPQVTRLFRLEPQVLGNHVRKNRGPSHAVHCSHIQATFQPRCERSGDTRGSRFTRIPYPAANFR